MSNRYGLEIRMAAIADAAGLAELLGSADLDAPSRALPARLEATRDGENAVFLALEWGPPSGVVALHRFRSLLSDAPVARIDLLLVSEDARRRGIARLLVKAASQWARAGGCDRIELADGERPDLLGFAAATGFERVAGICVRSLRRRPG
ncbi:GNAT family N-acetyltransferase [Rhizosaccharibacter radicis]|uniref:GNAT family N-acetyltransferase n=1 Tax=Rhizosaccharibacter radicis TaxID=2782605 RepID=A0ABT1VTP7_9PROT|nr:GNAT family N-acetyltransferase [Acetobacteraceae bacterium KSS12]